MAETEKKENKVSKFFAGVRAEFAKIKWPTRDEVVKQTTAVVVVSVICGALIAALDYGFGYLINWLTNLSL